MTAQKPTRIEVIACAGDTFTLLKTSLPKPRAVRVYEAPMTANGHRYSLESCEAWRLEYEYLKRFEKALMGTKGEWNSLRVAQGERVK